MKNHNHKLTSFKMVRKSQKQPSTETGERRDLWNILGFIFFVATVCIVATFTMRSHQSGQRSRRSGSTYQMCKFRNFHGVYHLLFTVKYIGRNLTLSS